MHVLIIPSWYFPQGTDEIPGRMFLHLAKALQESEVEAKIFYPDYSTHGPLFKRTRSALEEGIQTFRVQKFFPKKANAFLFNRWIRQATKALIHYITTNGKPDIIHAQSYFAASLCAALQDHIQIPFVYTERLSSFLTRQIPSFHHSVFADIFSKASAVTCVSPGLRDVFEQNYSGGIKIIPNFFDPELFHRDKSVAKHPQFTFVAVGEPANTKGLDVLFTAFAALKQKVAPVPIQLILADRIPEKDELMKQAIALGIEHDIEWCGLVSQQALAEIYQRSHVFVSASRVETFGKALIEAQACGLPAVTTKTHGSKYIMSIPQQGELVDINDAEALMRAMGKTFAGYAWYNPDAIVAAVEKRFAKKLVIRQWIDLYKSIQA